MTPRRWRGGMSDIEVERIEYTGETPIRHYALKTWFHGSESRYLYTPRLLRLIREIQPDIIHCEQGAWALTYTQAIVGKRLFAPRARCAFFTWVNLPYRLNILTSALERFNFRHSGYAIAGSHAAKQVLQQRGFHKPIAVIPQLGVDTALYKRQDVGTLKTRLGLSSFVVGYIGRIDHHKGMAVLIRALALLKDRSWQLLLVGKGNALGDVARQAGELGILDRLVMVDAVPNDQVPQYFNCVSVSVLPSLTTASWAEQFGHTVIESMACEVPVIGSDSGEIPHVIGDAGLIVKEGDAGDLAAKLRLIMENDQLRQDLIERGRGRVAERFTHAVIARQTREVYMELMHQG